VRLDEPSLYGLLDDVVSVADPRVRSLPSEELLAVPEPAPLVALKGSSGGIERGRGLLEEAVGARGTAAGSEGVWWDVVVGGCGVGCEIGRSNSCPPIIPPCEGETATRGATPFSGTWLS